MNQFAVLPENSPHAVRVLAFFPGGRRHPGKLRTFEYLIFVQANGARVAGDRAMLALRSIHNDPEGLEKLGPREKPSFYAVVWVCYVELPDGAAVPYEHPMVINYFTLEKEEAEALKTQGKARAPVSLAYVEE
jgi:hypothetical protein